MLSSDLFTTYSSLVFGCFLLFFTFAFKFTIVPFHFWVFDVYGGIPPYAVPLLAVLPKFSLLSIFFQLIYQLSPLFDNYSFLFISLFLFSVLIGGLGGLFETNIMRIVGLSGIVNFGFILTPLVIGESFALHSALLFIFVYFILIFNLFSIMFAFRVKGSFILNSLYDLRFVYHANPFIGILLILVIFSFIGLPPFAGFYPKLFFLISLFQAKYYITGCTIIFLSAISIVFYLRIIVSIIAYEKVSNSPIDEMSNLSLVLIYVSSMLNIFFAIFYPIINYWILRMLGDIVNPWIL